MLIRILNTLRSRIWDMAVFLFSVYSKSTVCKDGESPEGCGFLGGLKSKGLTFKLLYVVYSFYSNGNFQRKCVRPLEVKFPKSHILLVHSMLPNCGFSIVRKKGKILYPRCSLGACLRCDKHLKYSDYRADGI